MAFQIVFAPYFCTNQKPRWVLFIRQEELHVAVRLRLKRVGAKGKPAYRVIAIDRRKSRDGRELEIVGLYDPFNDAKTMLYKESIEKWLKVGAIPTMTVQRLIKKMQNA